MHTQKIVVLTNNSISTPMSKWLESQGHAVKVFGNLDQVIKTETKPDLIISYCYNRIISREFIEWMNGNIVNLHISYLPWNRGASPNFWSFAENTPQGVTLHYIDDKLDTGPIIAQSLVSLSRTETFSSSYDKLHQEAQRMFQNAFNQYHHWKKIARPQIGEGSYHTQKQLIKCVGESFDWNQTVATYFNEGNG